MVAAISDSESMDGILFHMPSYGGLVLREMAASMAYEINLSLAAIVLNGETILHWVGQDRPDMEEVCKLAYRIVSDAIRATEVITRIHSMTTKQPFNRTPVAINELITETMGCLENPIQRHAIKIVFELWPDLPMVPAVRGQIQQVVAYLALNAIESMSHVDRAYRRLVIRTWLADDANLHIEFDDSGTGLGTRTMEELSAPFFTTKPNRIGLGLTVCRSIVDAHRGRIGARQESNAVGTKFWFTLPVIA